MLEFVLPIIKDPKDYLTALSLFRVEVPMTSEESSQLLDIYTKYLGEGDQSYGRLCMAADLLPGRGRENKEDFAALGLEDKELDALFLTRELVRGKEEMSVDLAEKITAAVSDDELGMAYKILLARVGLDLMAQAEDYMDMREEIKTVANFLTECGEEMLDKYTVLIGEVRMKCRR